MIGIIDYGLGNVRAFLNIYRDLNMFAKVIRNADELSDVKRIVLPGVGSFDWAMERLNASGMKEGLEELVLNRKCSVLGVCVGMQMLARCSEEGQLPGLGWIPAEVKRFDEKEFTQKTRLPHMGWNDASPCAVDSLFRGMENPRFYFLHSYYFLPDDDKYILATTNYNGAFASAVHSGHIFGTQFHPEKSHRWGIQLLRNFAEI